MAVPLELVAMAVQAYPKRTIIIANSYHLAGSAGCAITRGGGSLFEPLFWTDGARESIARKTELIDGLKTSSAEDRRTLRACSRSQGWRQRRVVAEKSGSLRACIAPSFLKL